MRGIDEADSIFSNSYQAGYGGIWWIPMGNMNLLQCAAQSFGNVSCPAVLFRLDVGVCAVKSYMGAGKKVRAARSFLLSADNGMRI